MEETFKDIIDNCLISVTLSRHITPDEKLLQKLKLLNFEISPTEPRVLKSDAFPSPQTLLSFIETLRNDSQELRGTKELDKENAKYNLPYTLSKRQTKVDRFEAAKSEPEFSIVLNELKFGVSFRHALDFKPDLIVVVGEPKDVLNGYSGFKEAELIELDIGEKINNVKTIKLKKSSYIFQLVVDDFTEEALTKGFVNLTHAVDVMKDILKSIVFTGSFLNTENNGVEESVKELDSAFSRKFTQLVFDLAIQLANKTRSLKEITITASKEVYPYILKWFREREPVRTCYNSSETEFENTDDEDEITIFPMKKDNYDAARSYFTETEYSSYFNDFNDVIHYEIEFTSKDVKGKELLSKLKYLKVVPTEVENIDSVSALLTKNTKIIRNKDKINLVGPFNEVNSILKQVEIKSRPKRTETSDSLLYKITENISAVFRNVLRKGARTIEPDGGKKLESTFTKDRRYECTTGSRRTNYLDDYSSIYIHIGSTGLEISVHNADITKLRVDCIVNAANRHLRHGGGVAHVISKAAGSRLQDECDRYIAEYKSVQVTCVFVSTGGYLPAKHVIHAVGPRWDDYVDKNKCTGDLRRTVLTCLLEATKMKISTIALPWISAAIFRFQQDLCAEAYMHAVKNYDAIVQQMNLIALKEIHFVDINDTMIDYINKCFTKQWHMEKNYKFYEEDLNFAIAYMKKQSQASQVSRENVPKQDKRVKENGDIFISHTDKIGKASQKAEKEKSIPSRKHLAEIINLDYSFDFMHIKLTASAKHAFDFKPDLVIVVGDPFNKLSGQSEFQTTDLNEMETDKKIKNVKTFLSTKKDKKPIYVFELSTDEFNVEKLRNCFHTLDPTIALIKKTVTSLVITSKFLYPDKAQKAPPSKCIGQFALLVYDYVEHTSIRFVTVTASEDVIPYIVRVFQSRERGQTKPGGYHWKQKNKQ